MIKYLAVFFISMIPILELRFAVPFAVGMDLPYIPALITCVIGNMVPVPFVYMFARQFLLWGARQKFIGKFCAFVLEKGNRAGQKIVAKTGRGGTFVALMLFVGIPIPGTGAWTGTLAASLLDLGPKTTALSVSLGVVIAGIIMLVTSGSVFHIVGI